MRSMLKQRLYEAGMTAPELADGLGLSPMLVRSWSSGRGVATMPLGLAVEVAGELGCEVSDLFSPDGGPRRA